MGAIPFLNGFLLRSRMPGRSLSWKKAEWPHPAYRPPSEPLAVTTQDGRLVVEVGGELDCSTAPPLQERLMALIGARDVDAMVLDMAGVRFMDTSGLQTLVEVHRLLQSRGGGLVLRRPAPNVVKLLEITGMDQVLRVAA